MQFREAFDPARALQSAWTAIRMEPLPLVLGGFFLMLVDPWNGGSSSYGVQEDQVDFNNIVGPLLYFGGIGGCAAIVFLALSSWIYAGFAQTVAKTLVTGASDPGDLFTDKVRWLPLIMVRILRGLLVFVAALPLGLIGLGALLMREELGLAEEVAVWSGVMAGMMYLPVIVYVVLGLVLVKPAVALEDLAPVAALRRSWSLVAGHRWWMLLYSVLLSIVYVLGFLVCCIGIVGTASWVKVAYIESYLSLVKGDERPLWWIANPEQPARTPPPSDDFSSQAAPPV